MGLGSGARAKCLDEREMEIWDVSPCASPVSWVASNSLLSPTMLNGIAVGYNSGTTVGNTSPMLNSNFRQQMAPFAEFADSG